MPKVSVIVPCYNEQATIRLLLEAVYAQTFPRSQVEVIIADGLSHDQTLQQVESFRGEHPDLVVRVIENLARTIPSGLNRAIEAASGEIIVRLDAHSIPRPDYVANCVAALQGNRGANVGGVWEIRPLGRSWQARAIAAAASHPLGVGDAHYRFTGRAQATDTVPFGAFRRSLIDQVGFYDESLLTNEDYEFNTRVRQAGGIVWLDPSIRSTYFARASLTELARQYWRYGYWKARMLRRYPDTLRWRQALPPAFVLGLTLGGLLALVWRPAGWLLSGVMLLYLMVLVLAGLQLAWKKRDPALLLGVPLAIVVMHLAWGSAFLWSLFSYPVNSR
jgi:succinoglycan biosynthesis protein ExoA